MTMTTRRELFGTFGAFGAALTVDAAARPAVVTQREIQEVLDLQNRAQLQAARIRQRLEAFQSPSNRGTLCIRSLKATFIATCVNHETLFYRILPFCASRPAICELSRHHTSPQ